MYRQTEDGQTWNDTLRGNVCEGDGGTARVHQRAKALQH